MPVVNTETEITEPAFGYKLHGRWTTYFEFQFLNVYLVHRHVSCLPVQLFPPHNCVRKKQVEIFHRCRSVFLTRRAAGHLASIIPGPREVLLELVILVVKAIFMNKCFVMEIF